VKARRVVVETIWNADKTWRVDIWQRADGSFGFEELHFDSDELAWVPFGHYSESFSETSEDAIREARTRVSWAIDKEEKL